MCVWNLRHCTVCLRREVSLEAAVIYNFRQQGADETQENLVLWDLDHPEVMSDFIFASLSFLMSIRCF